MVVEREKDQKSRCFLGAKANGLSGPPLWEVRKGFGQAEAVKPGWRKMSSAAGESP